MRLALVAVTVGHRAREIVRHPRREVDAALTRRVEVGRPAVYILALDLRLDTRIGDGRWGERDDENERERTPRVHARKHPFSVLHLPGSTTREADAVDPNVLWPRYRPSSGCLTRAQPLCSPDATEVRA